MASKTGSAATDCGADILEALGNGQADGNGLTPARLAAVTQRDRGLAHRVVRDLLELGLIEHEAGTRQLRLGWGLYVMAARVAQQRLANWSQPVLDRLAARCRESAYVVVRQGADAVTVAEATPAMAVQVVSWVGRSFPVARSDAGPVLLQELASEELHELLGHGPLPSTGARRAPRSVGGLERLIADARAQGVSVLDEQTEAGVLSAAAPAWDFRGRLVAAVVVSCPAERVRGRMRAVAAEVVVAARELSEGLGSRA